MLHSEILFGNCIPFSLIKCNILLFALLAFDCFKMFHHTFMVIYYAVIF